MKYFDDAKLYNLINEKDLNKIDAFLKNMV